MQLFLSGESPLEPQRMAAKSCKEPTDVWEPQQSSGKKKGAGGRHSRSTKRYHIFTFTAQLYPEHRDHSC